MTDISVRCVYDPPQDSDGWRVLVDRLWPRGTSKAKARVDVWDREAAPSKEPPRRLGNDGSRMAAMTFSQPSGIPAPTSRSSLQSPPSAPSETAWPAPTPTRPLDATVEVPGSKSLSNRYLLLAALGRRPVTLGGLLRSRDTDLMIAALRGLGVTIEGLDAQGISVRVTPPPSGRFHGGRTVDCGLAGTVMRFLPGLSLFADGPLRFDGDRQAYRRPMKPVLDGLEQLGAHVDYEGRPGFLPFVVTPPEDGRDDPDAMHDGTLAGEGGVPEGWSGARPVVSIDSSSSSQFISGLLLVASRLPHGLGLRHTGASLPSLPHIRMTMADVKAAGGTVRMTGTATWIVEHADLQLPVEVTVEPDLSNAAPFLGAALVVGGTVRVPRWPASTTQPGGLLPGILERMGAQVTSADGVLAAHAEGRHILGLGRFDMSAAGEIAPSIAALATLADSPTELVGIGHLRGHETNRLAAMVTEIRRVGAGAEELEDGVAITPVPWERLHPDVMETYADHRMATFAAMLGLAIPGIRVRDIATTRKTIPDFTGMWARMIGAVRG
ncbi:3-phosphoshikimate 1-carboxyvinyltransferase [uncultured Bifidobacterium sp.]|uniref:DUF488 family protein, N3 subclade n=1 Tax=uncultured Bifidobacterium sp. TaxID=165187 RepID=UPI0028DD128A|nr:3-phosphoshikimate 1-carboxyvinyltransferase [uncultured Bifidobacterium sp.]